MVKKCVSFRENPNMIQIDCNAPNQSIGKQQHVILLVQKGSPIRYSSEEL